MRILLIGTGYIGSALYFHLVKNHEVEPVDLEWRGNPARIQQRRMNYADLTEEELVIYDAVILVAAHASASACNNDPYGAFENNVTNFVNLTKKLHDQKLIYASSSCVYMTQKDATEDLPLHPTDSLSFTKTCIDHFAQTNPGLHYYGLRFGSVSGYSPNMRHDLAINAMVGSALKNGYLTLGNAHAHRPFLGIKDLLRAVTAVLECQEDKSGIYNVTSFNNTFGETANVIAALTNAEVREKESAPTYDFTINTDKFKKSFGFQFHETIESLVHDHRKMLDM